MSGSAQVIRGDALALPLPDNSVDLCVTSPPYFGLRSYQDDGAHYSGQLGSEATPAEFVAALLAATREMVRVTKPSGSIWVNLGDKYAGSRMDGSSDNGTGATSLVGTASVRERAAANGQGRKARTSVPTKSLIGIPWRYALACIDDLGLILRAEVIWSKPNGLPESVTDRVRRSHETWFHFVLNPRYFSAVDEIREAHGPATRGLNPHGARGDHYRVGNDGLMTNGIGSHPTGVDGHLGFSPLGKLPGSVWTIPTQPLTVPDHLGVDHFAAFPMEWPRRIIAGWSPGGVCVECGEGRRPVAERNATGKVSTAARGGGNSRENGYADFSHINRNAWQEGVTYEVTGHACSCGRLTKDGTWISTSHDDASPQPDTNGLVAHVGGGLSSSARTSQTRITSGCATSTTSPATRPAVVLDPFGGTGTTALVAKALGRHGISVDMSSDYCRLATWRTTNPDQMAAAAQVKRSDHARAADHLDMEPLFDMEGTA